LNRPEDAHGKRAPDDPPAAAEQLGSLGFALRLADSPRGHQNVGDTCFLAPQHERAERGCRSHVPDLERPTYVPISPHPPEQNPAQQKGSHDGHQIPPD
jgi:hypothetical protein